MNRFIDDEDRRAYCVEQAIDLLRIDSVRRITLIEIASEIEKYIKNGKNG